MIVTFINFLDCISEVYVKHNILLYDTNEDEDVLINNVLLESGLAVLPQMEGKYICFSLG